MLPSLFRRHGKPRRARPVPRTLRRRLTLETLERRDVPAALLPADAPSLIDIKDTAYPIPDEGAYFVAPYGSADGLGTVDSPWNVQRAIAEAPAGSTIVFRGGEYRGIDNLTISRPLILQPYPHEQAWIKGSAVVTDWVADGGIWRSDGWVHEFPHLLGPEYIDPAFPLAGNRDMVFLDGQARTQVATRAEVVPGTFCVDYENDQLFLGDDPTGRLVESTAYEVAFVPRRGGAADATGAVIRGLGFTHFADWGVQLSAPQNLLENNTFVWNGQEGARVINPDAVLRGNLFTANGRKGVGVGQGHRLLLDGNLISYNNVERYSSTWDAAGIKLVRTQDMVLQGNLVERNYGTGIWMDISCIRATVVRNLCRLNRGSMDRSGGIFAELQHDSIIAFNVCHDNGTGIMVADSSNIRVYNNTLARNGQAVIVRDSPRVNVNAAELEAGITWVTRDVVVKNNLFADIRRTGPRGPLFDPVAPAGDDSSAQMFAALDFNAYYRSEPGVPPNAIRWDPGPGGIIGYATVAAFRAANPAYEENALVIDGWPTHPFFVDEAAGDYRLRADSPAVYRGEPLPADIALAAGVPAGEPVHLGALGVAGFDEPDVPLGINLAAEPGFEGDSSPWITSEGAAAIDDVLPDGSPAFLLAGPGEWVFQTVSGLEPGATYVLRAFAVVTTPGDAVFLGVSVPGGTDSSVSISSDTFPSGSLFFTLGPSDTSVGIWAWHGGSGGPALAGLFELFQVP